MCGVRVATEILIFASWKQEPLRRKGGKGRVYRRDGCDIAALEGPIGRGCARRRSRLAKVTEQQEP